MPAQPLLKPTRPYSAPFLQYFNATPMPAQPLLKPTPALLGPLNPLEF